MQQSIIFKPCQIFYDKKLTVSTNWTKWRMITLVYNNEINDYLSLLTIKNPLNYHFVVTRIGISALKHKFTLVYLWKASVGIGMGK